MPPIEVGPLRAIGPIEGRLARKSASQAEHATGAKRASSAQSAIIRRDTLEAGPPPVDAERVEMIRKAIEKGTYPLVPTKIADAMIAAGLLLRSAGR
ncbi:MAG: flagellar biosynthesis anti-sigma factor FlgM [Novosphingobium sp.]|nr:flagellar biosynthesis anti-sigma factor FlgM [Novosphingobium sp.]